MPKTPWGEPDLQGVWSSDDASGIPRERPKEFGNNLYLSDEAFADASKVEHGVKRGENGHRLVPQRLRTPRVPADLAHHRAAGRRHAGLHGRGAEAPRPRDRGSFGEGPFDTTEDFTLYDRCITRGIVGSVLPVVYGNGNRIVQAPGMVAFSYEMIHDTRVIYTDGRPHLGQGIRQ